MEETSWEDKVNGHPGLIFLVTQSPLQSTALVVFTRLHKLPLVNYSSFSTSGKKPLQIR